MVEISDPIVLIGNGESFRARAHAQQPGAGHVDWVSVPTWTTASQSGLRITQWESREEMERAVRSFLDGMDVTTGYLRA